MGIIDVNETTDVKYKLLRGAVVMKRKILATITSFALCVCMIAPTVYASWWSSALKSAIWYVITTVGNRIPISGETIEECGWLRKSSGMYNFNSDGNNPTLRIDLDLEKENLTIDTFPYTFAWNWSDSISVLITNPINWDIINTNLSHNQQVSFNSAAPFGDYIFRFTENDKSAWNCYITLTDWDAACGYRSYQVARDYNDPTQEKPYVVDPSTNKVYFLHSTNNSTSRSFSTSSYLDIQGLDNQLYDSEIQETVNNFKDYNVGDTLFFSDTITDVIYDKDNDATTIKLSYQGSDVSWPFKGDLTEKYKPGDTLSLKFKVIPEYSYENYTFENLDYFVEGAKELRKGNYVSIEPYLVEEK